MMASLISSQYCSIYGTLLTETGFKLGKQPIYPQENVSGSWEYAVGLYIYPDGYYAFTWPAAEGTHEYRALFDGATGLSPVASVTVTEMVS